jgi:hypothetical protein
MCISDTHTIGLVSLCVARTADVYAYGTAACLYMLHARVELCVNCKSIMVLLVIVCLNIGGAYTEVSQHQG